MATAEKVRAEDCQEVSSSVSNLKKENTCHEQLPEKHQLDPHFAGHQNVKEEKDYAQNCPEDNLDRFIKMDGNDVITAEKVISENCQEVSLSDSNFKMENTCYGLLPKKHQLDPCYAEHQNVKEESGYSQNHSEHPGTKARKKKRVLHQSTRPSKPKTRPLSSQQSSHVCEVCNKTFRKNCWLRLHFAVHTGDKPYSCSICPAKFASAGRLKAHEQRHIYVQPHARPAAVDQQVSSSDSNLKSENTCHELFPGKHQLDSRYAEPKTVKDGKEDKLDRYPLMVHLQGSKKSTELPKSNPSPLPSQQSLLVCEVCKKSFRKKCWLRLHCAVHTGDKPYSCSVCSAKFANAARLKTHEQRHSDVREHVCEFCQKSYRLKVDLNAHKKVHFRDKMFPCPICKKQFSRLSNLRQHCRVHTGEKMHVCEICDRRFSSKINLSTHYKKHDKEKTLS